MTSDDHTAHQERARQLLQELLPQARQRADAIPHGELDINHAGLFGCIGESNLDRLHVYKVDGGWMADFVLRDAPSFVPSVFGGRADSPMASRSAAIDWALQIITVIIAYERLRHDDPEPLVRFWLDKMVVACRISWLNKFCAEHKTAPRPEDEVRRHLDRLIENLLPDGVTSETFATLPEDSRALIISLCVSLVTMGVYQHPA